MKKLLMVFIWILSIMFVSGCTISLTSPEEKGFRNKSIQSKEDVLDVIAFYRDRMLAEEDEDSSVTKSLSNQSLNDLPVTYLRESLPDGYSSSFDPDDYEPELDYIMGRMLVFLHHVISACADFEEDEICDVELSKLSDYKIKAKVEGYQLYIEAYNPISYLDKGLNTVYVSTNMIYLNLIDDRLYFEHVADFYEKTDGIATRSIDYHEYYEAGDIRKIAVRMSSSIDYYYHKYERSSETVFEFSSFEDTDRFSYKDYKADQKYELEYQDSQLIHLVLDYGIDDIVFSYTFTPIFETPVINLKWNLLAISGWDKVVVKEFENDQVFNEDQELLTSFSTDIIVDEYTYAVTSIQVSEEDLVENLVNLSDYHLSFEQVTYEELIDDIPFFKDNYQDLLVDNGLTIDMQANQTILAELIPFFGDEVIINEIYDFVFSEEDQ